jgi:phospholipid transport system substrate-binding protein
MPFNPKRRFALLAACVLLAGSTMVRGANGSDDPAVMRIRAFYDSLLAVMKQAKSLGVRGRYAKLEPAIEAAFDLPAMTRIAVGPEWNSIPVAQQQTLIETFSRMTIATYANRFDGFSGERFEVEPNVESRNTGKMVHTKLIQSNGEPIALNYLVRGSDENWKVVDVYLTGTISELATRRAEFSSILKSGGPNALIESLRQQAERQISASAGS